MSASQSCQHRVVRIHNINATGVHDGGEAKVHVSRSCSNCARDGTRNAEWVAEGGLEKYGRCMYSCPIGDEDLHESQRVCYDHQTQAEFATFLHRPDTPVFVVLQDGAA